VTGNSSQISLGGRPGGAADSYLNAIRSNILLVVGIVAVTLASAAFGVAHRVPTYKASAEILLTPLPSGDETYFGLQLLRDSNDPTRTAQTAAALIDSPQAALATAARLGPPYTLTRVQDDVDVQPKGESNIVSVTATATDSAVAARLANIFAEEALQARLTVLREQATKLIAAQRGGTTPETRQRISQLQSLASGTDPTMSSSQLAQPPTTAEGRRSWLVMLLAAIAGFAIATGAALLAEFANRRMRDEGEIVSAFPLPVLARIPRLSRREKRTNGIGGSVLPREVREAFRSLQVQLDQHKLGGNVNDSRVLMVTSATQDDGKTSCAIGLAVAFIDAGYRVLLIEFDTRKLDVAGRLGLGDERGLTTLIDDASLQVEDLVVSPPHLPGLQVLLAGIGRDDAMLGAPFARRLPAVLDQAEALADYVILDTPPLGEVSDALRIIAYADDVLIVGRPGCTRSDDLELMRQLIERAQVDPRGFVLVGAGKRSTYYA